MFEEIPKDLNIYTDIILYEISVSKATKKYKRHLAQKYGYNLTDTEASPKSDMRNYHNSS